MSNRPGIEILSREAPPSRTPPTDTGVWYVAGFTERGSTSAPILVTSISDYINKCGARVTYGLLYDALDVFFREGGSRAYITRVVGPAPVVATRTLVDNVAVGALKVDARNAGDWGNLLKVEVKAGAAGFFILEISTVLAGLLETSPELVDLDAAVAWSASSVWVTISKLASVLDPIVAVSAALAGGTDDRTNAVDSHWKAAIDRVTLDYGPGQVSYPGRTTAQAHADQLTHASVNGRVALLDPPDILTKAGLIAAALAARTTNGRYGAMFGPWLTVPGVLAGTTRDVPPSAVAAGLIARSDARFNPNVPAAGANGQSNFALNVKASFSDADRDGINSGGLCLFRLMYGGVRLYGYRTVVDPNGTSALWVPLSHARLYMAIYAKAYAIGQSYIFAQLDGRRHKIAQYGGDLAGMLSDFWRDGALYGATPAEAYAVDVGTGVNTPATIAARELKAILAVKMSPFGELVTIEIVNTPITEVLA